MRKHYAAAALSAALLALPQIASSDIFEDFFDGLTDIANEIYDGVGAVPGLLWNAGRFYFSGPYGLVPALVEGKVVGELTKGLIKNRNPTPAEYEFAQGVFGATLPPRERIYITNLSGLEGRAFVTPDKIAGGKYMMNLGVDVLPGSPECYDDPMNCRKASEPNAGQLFIHEMTHVWQLYQASFMPEQVFKGIYTQIVEGKGAYDYTCGSNWEDYGVEQQASIADNWHGGRTDCEYRYVVENLRHSRLTPKHSVSGGTAASVSRTTHDLQVWWIAWNGSVQSAWWRDARNLTPSWATYELAPAGQAAVGGAITAVSRTPELLDIWWIGTDGSVQGASCRAPCVARGNWRQYVLAPAGSASKDGAIAAVSRHRGTTEVWWTGAKGSVEAAYSGDGMSWTRHRLAPDGSAAPAGGLAVVSRIPSSLEAWWIAPNGAVEASYFYDGGKWTRYNLAPAGSASPTGGLTAVSRIPQAMEVWWVGSQGSIEGAWWNEGANWARHVLAPARSAALTSNLAALSRIPNSMEVWWSGSNDALHDAYWFEGPGWRTFPLAPPGSTPQSGGLTAVTRFPNAMEVWTSGRATQSNGRVSNVTAGYYWYAGSNWGTYDLFRQSSFDVAGGKHDATELMRAPCSAISAGCGVTESSSLLLMLTN